MKINTSLTSPAADQLTDLKNNITSKQTINKKPPENLESKKKDTQQISTNKNHEIDQSIKPELQTSREIQTDKLLRKNNIGIPSNHAIKMQTIAKSTNTIFGIRPVENIARTLLNEGYPTKNFHVKGKSSNWGPQAGFICKNQHFSKKNGIDKDVKKFNADIKKGIAKGYFKTNPLKISQARIEELRDDLHLIETNNTDDNITIYATSPSGKEEQFIASYNEEDDMYEIYNAKDNTPIEVICDLKLGKPLTADYDLLLVAPRIETFNDNAKDSRKGKISIFKNTYISQEEKFKHIMENEDQNMGNLTERSRSLVKQINTDLNRGYGLEVAHHSDDAGNPNSNIKDNFPATFFLPKKVGEFNSITIIKDKKMFDEFVIEVKDSGFHFEDHPQWNVPRRPSFDESLNFFENKG